MPDSYAFWNNKGGVGKSFLCFVSACEYAHRHPDTDIYVIDLCPQANVSETLLGGYEGGPTALVELMSRTPRATVAGYLESRLNSPFRMTTDVSPFVCTPHEKNPNVPENLRLVCGDNLLEVLAEAMRQTSQLSIPENAWTQVLSWVRDLRNSLAKLSGDRPAWFLIDCNPSFAIYTQMGLVASDAVVVPFTADDSSRRGLENVVALLFGISDSQSAIYAKLSFSRRAKEDSLPTPKLHTFVNNRVTIYDGNPSNAFRAVNQTIQQTVSRIYSKNRQVFSTHPYLQQTPHSPRSRIITRLQSCPP